MKTTISFTFLIRLRFQGCSCKSIIAIFALRVASNHAYSPYNLLNLFLVKITTDDLNLEGKSVKGFDFLVNSFWPEVKENIDENLRNKYQIFFMSKPGTAGVGGEKCDARFGFFKL